MRTLVPLALFVALLRISAPQGPSATESYVLQGPIVRADSGVPIPKVQVTLDSKMTAITDSNGAFVIRDISSGSKPLNFSSNDFSVPLRGNLLGGNPVFARLTFDAQHPVQTVHIEMVPVATISGRLL